MRRTAIIPNTQDDIEVIARYLPENYKARKVELILIEGEDVAGWTMTDYVIPRLASGLHFAKEVDIYVHDVA